MHILGTAGHVDHGKSSLVRALTGTDPDRFIEERLRGMTLDLGFAHLRYDDGLEAGIVDVPGHERFLHNMLAGAAGMDVLLLVIAANEGPRPQTFEHLAILDYLNVRRTIVVLTKSDLVDAEELALVGELVDDALRGTFAARAETIAVSTTTGDGLDRLRAAIEAALRALPEREPQAPAYLPIDRVFALAGHGTIVTGTLMQGRVALGDELVLAPLGKTVRVRNLHVFGERRPAAGGGTRVAINVPAIDTSEAKRGDVLASAQFGTAATLAVTFRAFAPSIALLKRKTPVRAYLGSAELLGMLAVERVPGAGENVAATLRLRLPSIVIPGSAYVVRSMSPKVLLGGGTIGNAAAFGSAGGDDAAVALEDAPETKAMLAALRDAGIGGADASRLGGLANLRVERADAILVALEEGGRAIRLRRPDAFVDAAAASELFERVRARLAQCHSEEPWLLGLTSLAVARSIGAVESRLVRVLGAFVEDGQVAYRNGYYAEPDFIPHLTDEQRAFLGTVFAGDATTPNVPAASEAVRLALRTSRVTGVAAAYETLVTNGIYVRVGDAVYRSDQIERMKAALVTHLRTEKQITVSTFRELAGISRKYAVPLMEWFDAAGVTVRSGDVRFIRTKQP